MQIRPACYARLSRVNVATLIEDTPSLFPLNTQPTTCVVQQTEFPATIVHSELR